jgi:hypothetical protein
MEFLHHRIGDLGRNGGAGLNLLPAQPFRPARADWAQAATITLAVFALYAATSPRTLALEDDGLFILSSYFLGVEHPPGYPIFTLLGKLFTRLPFGSVAYRVHLVSALFGALTCGAVWLCARSLVAGRLPAYLAAVALALSPVFWSQALIAEVYTLNTFFFALLTYLGLQACPPGAGEAAHGAGRLLLWMAFVFGLSLGNHYPLMLLVAPAFVALLWPRRMELLKRLPFLTVLFALGLLPYVWLVLLSRSGLPISFYGPLDSLAEIWYFISRSGYAQVDHSPSAGWLDRLKFFRFQGEQLMVQFAVAGTFVAAAGFALQWRAWGRRVAAFFTIAFVMATAVLLLLLNFDYTSLTKHVFHVYPLPAYTVCALWIGLGFAWGCQRWRLPPARALADAAILAALILAFGARQNLLTDYDWAARYAKAVLQIVPKNALVFARGDADLAPIAYFHMVEGLRPDITLFNSKGLILGNRLFHPLRTDEESAKRELRAFVARQDAPVVFTSEYFVEYGRRDRWLYTETDKSQPDGKKVLVDIPDAAVRFFEESLIDWREPNVWAAYAQGELVRRYAALIARSVPRATPPDERTRRHVAQLSERFVGVLGLAEGMMAHPEGYSVAAVGGLLQRARTLMPSDVNKAHLSRFFQLRGALRLDTGDRPGGIEDFETAVAVWPSPDNSALDALEDLYRIERRPDALKSMRERIKRRGSL